MRVTEVMRLTRRSAGALQASAGVMLAVLAPLVAGCTLLSDFSTDACESDLECTLPGGEPRHCRSGRCVEGCRDNRHCASIDPGAPFCQYPGGECTGLTSPQGECSISSGYVDATMGALTAQDMLVLGAFAPRVRSSARLSLELAARELNQEGGPASRPLLLGVCNDAPEVQPRAMEYLLDDLRVNAIVTSLDEQALDIAASFVDDGGPLLLSPFGYDTPVLGGGGETSALWYWGPPYRSVITAYRPLVRALATSAETPLGDFKIALVQGTAREDVNLAALVRETLELGGADLRQLELEDRVHPFVLLDDPVERERAVDDLIAYAPDVILWFAGGNFSDPARDERSSVIAMVEARAAEVSGFAPVYVLGPRNVDDSSLQHLAREAAPYLPRLIGVRADRALDPNVKDALAARFREAYPRATDGPFRYHYPSHSTYDALYYLAYATTWSLQHGEERATDGLLAVTQPEAEPLLLGPEPAARARALELVAGGSRFDLRGTSGPASFDLTLQARPAAVRIYCWTASGGLEDGSRLDIGTDTFTRLPGNCPVGLFDEPE